MIANKLTALALSQLWDLENLKSTKFDIMSITYFKGGKMFLTGMQT